VVTKNIFLVNTRFHLLVAQSIVIKKNLIDAILITTDNSLLSDQYIYESKLWSSHIFIHKINISSPLSIVSFFRKLKHIKGLGTANLFWGNDYQIENQLIANCIELNEITLFDDGIATYISNNSNDKSQVKQALEYCIFGLLKRFLKNSKGIGYYPHHYHFCLYPDLITNEIERDLVEIKLSITDRLKNHTNGVLTMLNVDANTFFYLTQPISEYGVMSIEQENTLIKRQIDNLHEPLNTIVVKAHPSESATRHLERIKVIKDVFSGQVISNSELNCIPVEAFVDLAFKCTFLSLYSSALINLKIINNNHRCISGICESDIGLIQSLNDIIAIFNIFNVETLCIRAEKN